MENFLVYIPDDGFFTADDLIAWREHRGWTREQLGRLVNVSTGTIARWENNYVILPRSILDRLKALETAKLT